MKYDLYYIELTLRQNSASAEKISRIRWDFISEVNPKTVLDYGCGVGWFRAFRPDDVQVDSYDINKQAPQTGINRKNYDIICFWDVLEHITDFTDTDALMSNAKFVAITVPALPDEDKSFDITKWRHYKPGEHFHYLSDIQWDNFMKERGFKKVKGGYPECPPRSDIYSALYEKA